MNHIPCLCIPFHNRNTRRTHPVLTSCEEKRELTAFPSVGREGQEKIRFLVDLMVENPVKKLNSMVKGEIREGSGFSLCTRACKCHQNHLTRGTQPCSITFLSELELTHNPLFSFSNQMPPFAFLSLHNGRWSSFLFQQEVNKWPLTGLETYLSFMLMCGSFVYVTLHCFPYRFLILCFLVTSRYFICLYPWLTGFLTHHELEGRQGPDFLSYITKDELCPKDHWKLWEDR